MSNVIKFHGAMRPDAHERNEEARTLHARSQHDSAMRGLAPIRRPNVIHLSNSLRDRFLRMLWAIFTR